MAAAALVTAQVQLARTLPDYWQRFEAVSIRYLDSYIADGAAQAPSGGQGRGLLARLFRRG